MWRVLNVYVIAHINITVRLCVWCLCVHIGHWMTLIACSAPRGFHSSDAQRKSICLDLKVRKTHDHKHSFGSMFITWSADSISRVYFGQKRKFVTETFIFSLVYMKGGRVWELHCSQPPGGHRDDLASRLGAHTLVLFIYSVEINPLRSLDIFAVVETETVEQCFKNRKSDSDLWLSDFHNCLF